MVALSPLGGAGWQFFDSNGVPLAGGKLYTYTAGTTTPAVTYTSSAGTPGTENPNPIILDSAGRPPQQVWLVNNAVYKFTLTTAVDVPIWTKDNIPADTTAFETPLAIALGGTSATTAVNARTNLGAAASGVNTDITSLRESVLIATSGSIGATTLGYRGIPQNVQTNTYTLVLNDAGRHIANTTGGIVIPANSSVPFPVGTTLVLYNSSASPCSVSITSDTLRFAGTVFTGTRTLATYGVVTCMKVAATEWVILGAGLT